MKVPPENLLQPTRENSHLRLCIQGPDSSHSLCGCVFEHFGQSPTYNLWVMPWSLCQLFCPLPGKAGNKCSHRVHFSPLEGWSGSEGGRIYLPMKRGSKGTGRRWLHIQLLLASLCSLTLFLMCISIKLTPTCPPPFPKLGHLCQECNLMSGKANVPRSCISG